MLKITLFISGLLSFWYFVSPQSFSFLENSGEKVLGAKDLTQAANHQTVYTGLLAYCLDHGKLPEDLNQLFETELSSNIRIDLNELFEIKRGESGCEFQLKTL